MPSTSPLIVYTDIKSPYAYLARDLTHALEDELGITADWRHFTLDIPSYLGSARVDDQGNVTEDTGPSISGNGIKYAYMDARRRANLRGITLRGTQKIWDTSLVGIAFYRAKEAGPEVHRNFMQLVFEPFWKRELDVEDLQSSSTGLIRRALIALALQTGRRVRVASCTMICAMRRGRPVCSACHPTRLVTSCSLGLSNCP